MIVGITGHRTLSHDIRDVRKVTRELFEKHEAEKVVTGMALGFDTIAAEVALEMGIPFVAAIPFIEQAKMWPKEDQDKYLSLLEKAADVYVHPETVVGNKVYAGYFGRNRWIVSQSNVLVAYMVNDQDGGTAYTWKEATKKNIVCENVVTYLQ